MVLFLHIDILFAYEVTSDATLKFFNAQTAVFDADMLFVKSISPFLPYNPKWLEQVDMLNTLELEYVDSYITRPDTVTSYW